MDQVFQIHYQTTILPDGTIQSEKAGDRYFEIDPPDRHHAEQRFRLLEEYPDHVNMVRVVYRPLAASLWLRGGSVQLIDGVEQTLQLRMECVQEGQDSVPVVLFGVYVWSLKALHRCVCDSGRSVFLHEALPVSGTRGVGWVSRSDPDSQSIMFRWLAGEPLDSISGVRLAKGF